MQFLHDMFKRTQRKFDIQFKRCTNLYEKKKMNSKDNFLAICFSFTLLVSVGWEINMYVGLKEIWIVSFSHKAEIKLLCGQIL